MELLETELTYQGRILRQLKRQGQVAIYDVRNAGNLLYGYEVIIIKIAPAEEKFGRQYPERELYPSSAKNSDDWGTIAWSLGRNQKKEAFAMFNGLVKRYTQPQKAPGRSELVASEGRYSGRQAREAPDA